MDHTAPGTHASSRMSGVELVRKYAFIVPIASGVSVTRNSSEDCTKLPLRYLSTSMDSVPRPSQIHRRNG
jgi:hypothetical protein